VSPFLPAVHTQLHWALIYRGLRPFEPEPYKQTPFLQTKSIFLDSGLRAKVKVPDEYKGVYVNG